LAKGCVRLTMPDGELAEVAVLRDQDARLLVRPIQQLRVGKAGRLIDTRYVNIVTGVP
jgi:hypothetical protein